MTPEHILNADIKDIPVCLLQSSGNISTSCLTAFLEILLRTISADFCRNRPDEICQDSCQYIEDLLNWKNCLTKTWKTGKQIPAFSIISADAKALYSSLCRETVTKVLERALEKQCKFNKPQEIIVELNTICLNNVVTQYGDQLHTKKTEL